KTNDRFLYTDDRVMLSSGCGTGRYARLLRRFTITQSRLGDATLGIHELAPVDVIGHELIVPGAEEPYGVRRGGGAPTARAFLGARLRFQGERQRLPGGPV